MHLLVDDRDKKKEMLNMLGSSYTKSNIAIKMSTKTEKHVGGE